MLLLVLQFRPRIVSKMYIYLLTYLLTQIASDDSKFFTYVLKVGSTVPPSKKWGYWYVTHMAIGSDIGQLIVNVVDENVGGKAG